MLSNQWGSRPSFFFSSCTLKRCKAARVVTIDHFQIKRQRNKRSNWDDKYTRVGVNMEKPLLYLVSPMNFTCSSYENTLLNSSSSSCTLFFFFYSSEDLSLLPLRAPEPFLSVSSITSPRSKLLNASLRNLLRVPSSVLHGQDASCFAAEHGRSSPERFLQDDKNNKHLRLSTVAAAGPSSLCMCTSLEDTAQSRSRPKQHL